MENIGVISIGIKLPIVTQGDDLRKIIVDYVTNSSKINDGDILGITESVVARCEGNYVTVDDIALETERIFGKDAIIQIVCPIYSRNRFSIILKGIAKSCKGIIMKCPVIDEVGNPWGVNPWTGVNIKDYYREIVESENCIYSEIGEKSNLFLDWLNNRKWLICNLHNVDDIKKSYQYGTTATLADYFPDKCEYGLLGSNKANDNVLKLFPSKHYSEELIYGIKDDILHRTGKNIEVMIYGDGCFKDPDSGIWEFADPVASPAYTEGLKGSPNEIKLKAFADGKYKYLYGNALERAIKDEIANKKDNLTGKMEAQGTTPRRYVNLLASLMDLTSGSGDRGTPVILVKNYFKNFADA